MRIPLSATSSAIALALLAGCSASQNAATIPFSGTGAQNARAAAAPAASGTLTPLKVLQLEAAGKMEGPAMPGALNAMLAAYAAHPHPQVRPAGNGTVAVWTTNQLTDYVIGFGATLQKPIVAIVTDKNGGLSPVGLKVDHNQNIWVADQYASGYKGGVVQEYDGTGAFKAGYAYTPHSCGTGTVTSCSDYGYDAAVNANSVFAAETAFTYKDGNGASDFGSGIFRFTNGKPSGTPKYYPVSDNNANLNCTSGSCDQVFYLDVDGAGNVWFDFMLRGPSYQPSSGLGELTKAGVVKIIKPAGTWVFPGGVYVTNGGTVLNVTDQNDRKTYQFHLPVTATSNPFKTIGPTPTNVQGLGDPVVDGFNATDSSVIFGDAYGWVDRCTVSTNACKAIANVNFLPGGVSTAAYTPSDK